MKNKKILYFNEAYRNAMLEDIKCFWDEKEYFKYLEGRIFKNKNFNNFFSKGFFNWLKLS